MPEYGDAIIMHRGRYYDRFEEGFINSPYVDNSYKWAGGGFLSTSEDLILFAKAHLKPGYLSQESLALLTTSQKLKDGTETGYGLGWVSNTDKEGNHWIGHSGGAVGGTSKLVIYPDQNIIVVVLTNLSGARLGDFPHKLAWLAME
jgi:CubicO group peptidase (beta-lactamase class C family)